MTTPIPGLRRASVRVFATVLAGMVISACAAPPAVEPPAEPAAPATVASATPLIPSQPTTTSEPAARALTEPGCCARHWWSADGASILFIDDPDGAPPLGIYAVAPDGEPPRLVSTSVTGEGLPPGDLPPQMPPAGPGSVRGGDAAFRLPADAENIRLSPDGSSVAWTVGSSVPVNVDRRQRSLWVIAAPFGPRRSLAILTGGDLVGWSADGAAVIVTGRPAEDKPPGVWRLPIDGAAPTLLAQGERVRGAQLSPSGGWLAFYLAFESDPLRNGLWVVSTSHAPAQPVPAFGSYRWGADERLYVIPYVPDRESLSLAAFDPSTGAAEELLDGDVFPGGIAANDWSLSPDGDWIVYRSSADAALWIVSVGSR